jgi:hypothetical protein
MVTNSDLLLAWKNFCVENGEGKIDVVHLHIKVFVNDTLWSRRQASSCPPSPVATQHEQIANDTLKEKEHNLL